MPNHIGARKLAMAFTVRLLLFSSLFLLPVSVFAQTNGGRAVGDSLTATAANSSSWLSPSGDFAFGFWPLGNNDLFLLSIWYANIPDRTVVWYANGDNEAAVAPKGSTVNLTADSGLVLRSPQGEELWKSEIGAGVVANGVMNDTGNFVLHDRNSESLWETFNNPTDTMLPGQTFERSWKLSSRQSETNYSKGRFQLLLQEDGNLVISTINLPTNLANDPYYATDTTSGTVAGSEGRELVFNASGYLYVLRENGGKYNLPVGEAVSARDNYIRATLNFDGIFAQYYHPRNFTGNVSWTLRWSEPDDICQRITEASGVGVCGYNSICSLKDKRPTCGCPKGFSLLDPNDPYRGCKPDFIQGCEEDELSGTKDLYDVEVLINTDWPISDYVQLKPFTAEKCNESCFQDCLCAVAIFRSETCWKKKLPLSNGRVDTSLNSQAFIKVRKDNSTLPIPAPQHPCPDDKKKKSQTTVIRAESVLLGTSIFVNFILGAALCLGFVLIFRKKHVRSAEIVLDSNLRSFSYEELQEATNGFKEELGKGAFGTVYKGVLQIGSGVQVAVKKLNYVMQEIEKEFKTELNVIGQTHHKNLVRLFGYCDEGQQRLLVYELLSNGTLASYLFTDIKPSWRQRIEIAYGVARGLLYLHEECSTQIIHCDIKPQNILLDDYYTARISDFGLAKLLMMNQSKTHTAIRGTKGYVAPEWFRNMPITTKVDVYSFGVVLLEIICCRRSVDAENNCEEKAILTDWVYDCFLEGALDAVVDYEVQALGDKTTMEKFVMVAIWCIQEDPSLRPNMRKVVQMLEGVVEVQVPPCPSPFSRACLKESFVSQIQSTNESNGFCSPHLLFLLFLLLPFSVIAQTNGNISVGGTLTAGEESAWWLSPSNDFALGFQKLDNDHFLLAIWCHKIPQKTIVWYANEGNPAPRKSKVELTDQGLLLRPPQGDQQLLTEFPAAAIAYGVMNDTGNFLIVDTSFRVIWETFNHPTDTLLPTQTMEIGGLLYSRQTETNFSRGRYQFQMLGNGDAVLNPINVPGKYTYDTYYISSSHDEANDTNSGHKVIFDQSGYLYILRRSGERFFITTPGQALSPTRYYVRATLHFDGVFIISYQLKNSTTSESWSVIHTEPDNICVKIAGEIGTGPCGYNSVCTLKEDRRPSCRCPVGYSLLNPTDEYSGCKAAFL